VVFGPGGIHAAPARPPCRGVLRDVPRVLATRQPRTQRSRGEACKLTRPSVGARFRPRGGVSFLRNRAQNTVATPAASCTTRAAWISTQSGAPPSSPCAAQSARDSRRGESGGRGRGGLGLLLHAELIQCTLSSVATRCVGNRSPSEAVCASVVLPRLDNPSLGSHHRLAFSRLSCRSPKITDYQSRLKALTAAKGRI
jgi:hypothetical protein